MNALEAKARHERFAALVAGDPLGRQGIPESTFDGVLKSRQTVDLDELVRALGGVDRNRIAHHLLARGYAPSEADANVFERRPWHSLPWPAAEGVTK